MTQSSNPFSTISLIGMPGAGKSTVGVLLAKLSGLAFTDTDVDIQVHAGATLEEILAREGHLRLREIEEEVLLAVPLEGRVVSTGGSVVYSSRVMQRLRQAGPVVYLQADLPTLTQRIAGAPPRGIARPSGQTFADVFAERTTLYERYANHVVDATAGSADRIATAILHTLGTAD
jgi:shikimate kinase